MAKSSINFAKASSGGLRHNDRTHVPDYLLPEEFRLDNSCDLSAKEADKKMMALYADAKKSYQEHTGQKLQATSYKWEAVINLNKEHTLEDVHRLVKEIEKETGFTAIQSAIHRDEGRVERGTPIYNLHAHVTFFTLDKNGEQLYRRTIKASDRRNIEKDILANNKDIKKGEAGSPERKVFNKLVNVEIKKRGLKVMDTKRLSEIQTMTAKSLGMVRGKKGSTAVRLGHKAYRASKSGNKSLESTAQVPKKLSKRQIESLSAIYASGGDKPFVKKYSTHYPTPDDAYPKSLPTADKKYPSKRATKIELAQAKALLRAEMQEAGGYGRPEYALMEQKYKDLKEKLKGKNLTISELEQANNALRVELKLVNEYNSEKEILEEEVAEKDLIIVKKDEYIKLLEDDITRVRQETKEVLIDKMSVEDELEELQEEYSKLKKAYNYLKDKYQNFVNKFKKEDSDELHLRNS